jgi:putative heme iron utilization protein
MDAIDSLGMDITAQVNGQPTPVRVTFDRELTDAKDAHHVLVEMLKAVRTPAP